MPAVVSHRSTEPTSVCQLSVSHRKSSPLRIIFTTCLLCVLLPTSRPHISEVPSSCQYHEQHGHIRFYSTFVSGKSQFCFSQSSFTTRRRRSPSPVWSELPWEGVSSWLSSWSGSSSGSRGSGRRTRRWWRRRRSSRAAGEGGISLSSGRNKRKNIYLQCEKIDPMWHCIFLMTRSMFVMHFVSFECSY